MDLAWGLSQKDTEGGGSSVARALISSLALSHLQFYTEGPTPGITGGHSHNSTHKNSHGISFHLGTAHLCNSSIDLGTIPGSFLNLLPNSPHPVSFYYLFARSVY